MTYYLYKRPDNTPYVATELLDTMGYPGYQLVSESDKKPDIKDMAFNPDNTLVPRYDEPEYVRRRRREYPKLHDQFDMLWHAMDTGSLPKAEPFYGEIKKVKDKYPKP